MQSSADNDEDPESLEIPGPPVVAGACNFVVAATFTLLRTGRPSVRSVELDTLDPSPQVNAGHAATPIQPVSLLAPGALPDAHQPDPKIRLVARGIWSAVTRRGRLLDPQAGDGSGDDELLDLLGALEDVEGMPIVFGAS